MNNKLDDSDKNMEKWPYSGEFFLKKLINYALDNVVAVLTSFILLVGGILLFIYFINIRFMPDLSSPTTLLLFAMAGICMALFFLMIFVLMSPALILNEVNKNNIANKHPALKKYL